MPTPDHERLQTLRRQVDELKRREEAQRAETVPGNVQYIQTTPDTVSRSAQSEGAPAPAPEPHAEQPCPTPQTVRSVEGRFEKGSSGNPKGRPRAATRAFTEQQIAEDWIERFDELFSVTIGGKIQKLPYHIVLLLKLQKLALASDDIKIIMYANDQYQQAMRAYEAKQSDMAKMISSCESALRLETNPRIRKELEVIVESAKRSTRTRKKRWS